MWDGETNEVCLRNVRVFPHKQHIKSSSVYPPKQSNGLFRKHTAPLYKISQHIFRRIDLFIKLNPPIKSDKKLRYKIKNRPKDGFLFGAGDGT